MELLTTKQMRKLETDAIKNGQVTGAGMMESAGAGVVARIAAHWPDMTPKRAAVLCGPGNNGGDGFVIARLLKDQGWDVTACLIGEADALSDDARQMHDAWAKVGPIEPPDTRTLGTVKAPLSLVIDALFGTGLTRDIDGEAEFLLTNLATLREQVDLRVVSVDLPSGISADTGQVLGTAPKADLTVTFHAEKRGHRLGAGPKHCGLVDVVDIGLPRPAPDEEDDVSSDAILLVDPPKPAELAKEEDKHKYEHGHALVFCGDSSLTGAPRLAARAALRVGAGAVSLAVAPKTEDVVVTHETAIMIKRAVTGDEISELLWDARINAICMGPGLGHGPLQREKIEAVLNLRRPVVLDADVFSCYARRPHELWDLTHDRTVLTPHIGEFNRVFDKFDLTDPVTAVRQAADTAGCVVLLKGPDTLIAAPGGPLAVHSARYDRAAPWLATAGSGDVLAGLITGLLARGHAPFEAAQIGAWLHCSAALRFGPGLIAEDLPDQLPGLLRDLGV